jgi:2-alkyl-3-oxoalkanoate reductase
MRVFVAGGTGAIGRHLIPALIADGHQVTASSRSAAKSAELANRSTVLLVVLG